MRRNGFRLGALLALLVLPLATGARAATDFKVHGLLDLVGSEIGEGYELNLLARGDSNWDPYALRLMVDADVMDHLSVYTQFIARDQVPPYIQGAYVMYSPSSSRDFHVLAGKIPSAVGTYAPRTYSNHNPLIGTPLMYQYHSTLIWYDFPPSTDALLKTRGSGQYGVNYRGFKVGMGMATIDDSWWDVGVTVTGSARPIEYAAGVTAGTPGWGNPAKDENSGKSVLGRVGLTPWPALRIGVSGSYGPYLVDGLNPKLPAGKKATDYNQILGMADFELLVGHAELRAEGAYNRWQSPIVGNLDSRSGYAELKYGFSFGGYLAGRYDVLRFSEITSSAGVTLPWDADVSRYEVGAGYRMNRSVLAKLVYQSTTQELGPPGALDRHPSLVGGQLSVLF